MRPNVGKKGWMGLAHLQYFADPGHASVPHDAGGVILGRVTRFGKVGINNPRLIVVRVGLAHDDLVVEARRQARAIAPIRLPNIQRLAEHACGVAVPGECVAKIR